MKFGEDVSNLACVTSEAAAWHFLSENTRCHAAVGGPLGQSRPPISRIMVQCRVHITHRHPTRRFHCPDIPSKDHTWNYRKTWQCHANVTQVKLEIFSSKIHSEVYQNCHVEWIDAIKSVPLHTNNVHYMIFRDLKLSRRCHAGRDGRWARRQNPSRQHKSSQSVDNPTYPVFRRTLRNSKVTAVQTRMQTSSESCMSLE